MTGLGGRRLDQRLLGTSRAGTGPAPQTGVFIGRVVVIFGTGPNTGLFVYNGQPKLGNPPVLAVTTASADPYGNPVNPLAITDSGMPLLIYSGPAASGNLLMSVAPAAGTDAFGNAYQAGATSYDVGTAFFTQLARGALLLGQASDLFPASVAASGGILELFTEQQAAGDIAAGLQMFDKTASPTGHPYALFSADLQVTRPADGNTYDTERLTLLPGPGPILFNSTAAVQIGNLAAPVAAGSTYRIHGQIRFKGVAASAGNAIFSLHGPAVSALGVTAMFWPDSGAGISINAAAAFNLTDPMTSQTLSTATEYVATFDGWVSFTAAGTFSLQAACSNAADTFNVLTTGSYLELQPVVA